MNIETVVLVLAVLTVLGCSATPAPQGHEMGKQVLRASSAIGQICEIGFDNDDLVLSQTTKGRIETVVHGGFTSRELGVIAIACAAMCESATAEDARCYVVLLYAKETCIKALSYREDDDALMALANLQRKFDLDGGASLIIKSAIAHQAELRQQLGRGR
jgi:hypothetical protein